MTLIDRFCGADDPAFLLDGEIGPCWRGTVFLGPAALYLGTYGVSRFVLVRATLAPLRRMPVPGLLDAARLLSTIALCVYCALGSELTSPHDVLDEVFLVAPQFLWLCVLGFDEIARGIPESPASVVGSVLWVAGQIGMFASTMIDPNDSLDPYTVAKLSLGVVAGSTFALFARDYKRLSRDTDYASLSTPPRTEENRAEQDAGLLSRLLFFWMSHIVATGYARPLKESDFYDLKVEDESRVLSVKFAKAWRRKRTDQGVARALHASGTLTPFYEAAFLKLLYDSSIFLSPQLLKRLIRFMSDDDAPPKQGYVLAAAMLGATALQTLVLHQYFHKVFRTGMRVRTALITAIYAKSLKLSGSEAEKRTTGSVVNLMAADCTRLEMLFPYLHTIWSAPYQVVLALYFLYLELGWTVLVAIVSVLALLVPSTFYLLKQTSVFQKELMTSKDERVRKTAEMLSSMKVLKLYGWEESFADTISGVRLEEVASLRWYVFYRACGRFVYTAAPITVTLATFGVFTLTGHELTPEIAFTSLMLLNILRFPLLILPNIFNSAVDANVSLNRVSDFLNCKELFARDATASRLVVDPSADAAQEEEVLSEDEFELFAPKNRASSSFSTDANLRAMRARSARVQPNRDSLLSPYPSTNSPSSNSHRIAIECKHGNFFWDDDRTKPALRDAEFCVERGDTCFVLGEVGSGKTALMMALVGDLTPSLDDPPYVSLNGSVAYCSQVPWILNDTLKNNILFGEEYEEDRYEAVVKACALAADFTQLPNGDATEIGERGINLSGGQKARISLARAAYSHADILLLESVFEAVDEHVGAHLWAQCFKGWLADRTVVLVTHSLKFLSQGDSIALMKDGRLVKQGGFEEMRGELQSVGGSGERAAPVTKKAAGALETAKATPDATAKSTTPAKKLIEEEESRSGNVSWSVYASYFKGAGGISTIVLVLGILTLSQLASVGTNRWLAYWSASAGKEHDDRGVDYYLGVYAGLSITTLVLLVTVVLLVSLRALNASIFFHEAALAAVRRAPMSFFDTTPVGRVLNRFSQDMYTIDHVLPNALFMFLSTSFDVVGTLAICAYVAPPFLIAVPILFVVYYFIQRYYIASSRELKRWDSKLRAPVYSHFAATVDGATSIRAYRSQQKFIDTNHRLLDVGLKAFYMSMSSNRWLATRLEFVGNFMVFFAASLTVQRKGTIDASLAGLALTYAMSVTQGLNWGVRMISELETNVVAVERVDQYLQIIPEAPEFIEDADEKLPSDWPSRGEVEFVDVRVRYRAGLEEVLKGVSFTVQPGNKIGIVGRTGSGKSTAFLTLLRILEPHGGRILIDDVDISKIGLRRLRSSVAVVPQDPVLFAASVRYNLDPCGEHADADMWAALESTFLKAHVESLSSAGGGGLDALVAEGGSNFSFGQRQLLTIARALLRKSKILLLDEASSGIDRESDSKIQQTLSTKFRSQTQIVIAHRIETILESDAVAVMDAGKLVEYGPPKELMKAREGAFSSLVEEMRSKELE